MRTSLLLLACCLLLVVCCFAMDTFLRTFSTGERVCTHTSFAGGKYIIPEGMYTVFLRRVARCLSQDSRLFLNEIA